MLPWAVQSRRRPRSWHATGTSTGTGRRGEVALAHADREKVQVWKRLAGPCPTRVETPHLALVFLVLFLEAFLLAPISGRSANLADDPRGLLLYTVS